MTNLDELLAQLREEYQEKAAMPEPEIAPAVPPPSPAMDSLLAEVKAEVEGRALPLSPHPLPDPKLPETGSAFELTQALRQDYEEQQRAEAARQQQHLQEQQRQEARQQQQRRASLSRQAQAWLQGLDPHSEEGLWFEEFSYAYESKLEAAIDYLEALREARA